jgi:hypothetical protein
VKFLTWSALFGDTSYVSIHSLGGVLAADKVVDNVGVTDTLLNGLSVTQVVFLQQLDLTFNHTDNKAYHEYDTTKITSDLQVSLGHLLAVRNDNGASLASCGPSVTIQLRKFQS